MQFGSLDGQIQHWLEKYEEYTESTIIDQLFGKRKSDLDSIEMNLLQKFRESKTAVRLKAKPLKGKFPLVIYHQGAGASLDDNAILCEWLASNGYIVMGSSFQASDGTRMSSAGEEGAVKDIGFLLSFAKKLPNVDWMNIAMIGHSLGGQVANYAAAQGNMPVDALICLETTQEYYFGDMKLWPYVTYVSRNADKVNTAFLFASNPYAIHDLADNMKNADRYYLTIPGMEHNDFISQGIQKKFLSLEKERTVKAEIECKQAKEKYVALNNYILAFLDARLKNDPVKWDELLLNNASKLGHTPFLEHMPSGQTTYAHPRNTKNTPSPRQLKFLVLESEIDSVVKIINKSWQMGSKDPIYDPVFIYAVVDYLLKINKEGALNLYNAYKLIVGRSAVNRQFIYFGRIFSLFSTKEEARAELEKLLFLDPENTAEVKQLIKKYAE